MTNPDDAKNVGHTEPPVSHNPEDDARDPLPPPNTKMRRLVKAADAEGDLFTPDDLLAALLISEESEADARQIAADWTRDGITAGAWTEDVLLLVALAVEGRAERIRRHLGFSPERMAQALDELRRRLPQP